MEGRLREARAAYRDWWKERSREAQRMVAALAVAVVLLLGSGAVVAFSGSGDSSTRETLPSRNDGLADEAQLERALNSEWGVRPYRDSGATCVQTDRAQKRYGCRILQTEDDVATGFWVACPRPVTSAAVPAGCTYRTMSLRQRCLHGVRSGKPGTEIWNEEEDLCSRLDVDR